MERQQAIIAELEADIKAYDHVFLVRGKDPLVNKIATLLRRLEYVGNPRGTRLVLFSQETSPEAGNDLSHCLVHRPGSDKSRISERKISTAEADMLCRLYGMYEFSDRFHVLSRGTSFGGLLNYIDTGLLGEEEALKALLY